MRRLLLFDVLANDSNRCATTATGKVAGRPQRSTPKFSLDAGVIFLANHPAGHALEAVHQSRYRHLGWVVHQQVNVIVFAIELNQFRLKVCANAFKDLAQVVNHLFGEDATAVFGHKDQMHMHQENTVSTVSNLVVISHRPKYN